MSKRLGEEGGKAGFQKSLGRWGERDRALSGDYFMLNCTALFQRGKLVEPGFQGGRFGDTVVRTLDVTQRGD